MEMLRGLLKDNLELKSQMLKQHEFAWRAQSIRRDAARISSVALPVLGAAPHNRPARTSTQIQPRLS